MAVGVLSNFNMSTNTTLKVSAVNEFPTSPEVGELAFKSGILWIYSQAGGESLTWYPLTNIQNSYTHVQGTASSVWNVAHNLNSVNYVYQVFDNAGNSVVVNISNVDADNAQITFGEPVAGTAVLVADADNYGMKSIDLGTM
jgi:hypothetical protein